MTSNQEFTVQLEGTREDVIATVEAALKTEGFGVLTRIDIDGAFKEKLGEDFRPYTILGACNPKLADRVISSEPNAGTLLPCNIVMRADDNGNTVVSFLDPVAALGMTETEEPKAVAADAKAMLERVAEKLKD